MRTKSPAVSKPKTRVWIYMLFVLVTSFFTYVFHYTYPPYPFWDEPYHIAAAQKYLNGVYFMEQHPPLGKLLIALGEKITRSDPKESQFIGTDYARNLPTPFNFSGYRLFPALLGWLVTPLLFLIFLMLTESAPLSALLSFLYIFDNAEILQSRAAMLDSTLAFFSVLSIYLFLIVIKSKNNKDIWRHIMLAFIFGLSFGLVIATKVVGLIMILLLPAALWWFYPDWRRIFLLFIPYCFGFLLVFVAVWQIHFSLGSRVIPSLPDSGYYQASNEYKQILTRHENTSLKSFPVMLRDSLKFVSHYNGGVPHLDLCKSEENGSPAYFWPFGARTINYRWEKSNDHEYRYLYMVSNPVGWGLGLLGLVLGTIVFIGPFLHQTKERFRRNALLGIFLGIYVCYMLAVLQITRVMYLYHYFIPLLLTYIIFGLVIGNIPRIGRFVLSENRRLLLMTFLGLLIFASFQFYRPLTYDEQLKNEQVERRDLLPLWEIRCVECSRESTLVSARGK